MEISAWLKRMFSGNRQCKRQSGCVLARPLPRGGPGQGVNPEFRKSLQTGGQNWVFWGLKVSYSIFNKNEYFWFSLVFSTLDLSIDCAKF